MISVIIPAYNEEKTIASVIDSLAEQKTKKRFEVIVVDNNSTDNTSKIAKGFKGELDLHVILEKKQGRGAARACGAKHAKGNILAYIDADTIADPNWINAVSDSFKKRSVVAATGPWVVEDIKGFSAWFLNTLQNVSQLPYRIFQGNFWLNGMNMAIRRSAYDKVGGFDPELNAHEDIDITGRLIKIGKIKFNNDMKVVTSGRRYKYGLIRGLLDYQKTWFEIHILGRKGADLKDVR